MSFLVAVELFLGVWENVLGVRKHFLGARERVIDSILCISWVSGSFS